MWMVFIIVALVAVSMAIYETILKSEDDTTTDRVMQTIIAIPVVLYTAYQDLKAKIKEKKSQD
ncbi:MAG: hypothetical protein ACRCWQ_14805 [Bacilli bacterium]